MSLLNWRRHASLFAILLFLTCAHAFTSSTVRQSGPCRAKNLGPQNARRRGLPRQIRCSFRKVPASRRKISLRGGRGDFDASPGSDLPLRGVLAVLGGTLVQMTLGSMYCWASIVVYAPNHLQTNWMIAGTMMGSCIWVPLLTGTMVRLGPIRSLTIGSQICALAVLIAGFTVDFGCSLAVFMIFYVGAFSLGQTMAYSTTLPAGWAWFPKHRGTVSGFILGGFGAGSLFFNFIASYIVNPQRLPPIGGSFPAEVTARFSLMVKVLAVCYCVMAAVGSSLISFPPARQSDPDAEQTAQRQTSDSGRRAVMTAVRSRGFLILFCMAFLHSAGTYLVAAIYRIFGQATGALRGDGVGALIGGLGALANGVGRPIIGGFVDRYGVKRPWVCLALMQAALLFSYQAAAKSGSAVAFGAATTLVFLSLGGSWAIGSTACSRAFGPAIAPYVFSYLFLGYSVATAVGPGLIKVFGIEAALLMVTVTSLGSAALAMAYPEEEPDTPPSD